jgi:hypothetical protein
LSQSVEDGIATCTTSSLTGTNTIYAYYSGDTNDATSSTSLSYIVAGSTLSANPPLVVTSLSGPFTTNLTLTASGGSSTASTTFTAVNGTATGCTATLSGSTYVLSVTDPGTCLVTAAQAPYAGYAGESSTVATVDMYSEYLGTWTGSAWTCPQGGTLTGGYYCLINGASPAVPGAPTSVTADGGSGSAVISWIAPNANGSATITSYTVTASPGGETCVATTGTGCTVTGLTNGTSYTFSVFATNSDGNSAASTPSNAVVPLSAPGAPTGLSATVTSPTSATLTWSAPTTTGGAPIVDYTATAFLGGVTATQTCSTTTATTCTITGLTTGDAYTFSVTSRNVAGTSATSSVYPAGQDVWTATTLPSWGYAPAGGAYGNGVYVVLSDGNGEDFYSTNGTTWSTATMPYSSFSSVVFGNGVFVAVAYGTGYIAYSSNGITWTLATDPGYYWADVSYVGGEFIVQSTSSFSEAAYSTNGVTWTGTPLPSTATGYGPVVGTNGTDLMVGYGNDQIYYSTNNGATWTSNWASFSGAESMNVSYANGEYFVTENGSTIWYSTNCVTWSTATLPSTEQWQGVSYANGAYFVNSPETNNGTYADNVVAYSTNGVSWSQTTNADDGFGQTYNLAGLAVGVDMLGSSTYLYVTTPMSTNGGTWLAGPYLPYICNEDGCGNFVSWGIAIVNGNQIVVVDDEGQTAAVLTDGMLIATAPSAPGTPVAAANSATSVSVSWTAPTSSNGSPVTSYTVTASPGGQTCTSTTTLSCTVNSLTNGTSYTFKVTATNAFGTGSSSPSSNAVIAASVPGYPTAVSATVTSSTSVTVTWSAPYSNGGAAITSYTATASPGGQTCTTATMSCTITGLTTGDAYIFTVTATNATGTSIASSQFPAAANAWATSSLQAITESTALAFGNGYYVALGEYNVNIGGTNSTTAAYSSNDGTTWTASAGLQGSEWDAVTFGNGEFVAVGANYSNAAISTNNGATWTLETMPASDQWDSVTYGNGEFVAVAYGGEVAYSVNGIAWTLANSPSAYWTSITFAHSEFVAVSWGSSSAMYSANGSSWTSASLPASAYWSSVTYGNGEFVAIAWGSTDAAYSSNGTTWTLATLPASESWSAVAFAGSQFYAIAFESSATAVSTSGSTWSVGAALPTASNWIALCSSGTTLLASSYYSANAAVTPAISNTAAALPGGSDGEAIVYGDSTYVALGDYGAASGGSASTTTATSPNGTSWSAGGALPVSEDWDAAAFGNGTFVAVSYGGGGAYSTNNGATWSESNLPTDDWGSVTYGNGEFVAITFDGTDAAYSSNGISWTTDQLPADQSWISVTYGNGEFVVVATAGSYGNLYSTNGSSWSSNSALAGPWWTDVVYTDGEFVAVSKDSTAAYSTNGTSWTIVPMPSGDWGSVVYAGGTLEAFNTDGNDIAISTNGGASWSVNGIITQSTITSATYVNGEVVAVGGGAATTIEWTQGLMP